jgi:hypothetical protein
MCVDICFVSLSGIHGYSSTHNGCEHRKVLGQIRFEMSEIIANIKEYEYGEFLKKGKPAIGRCFVGE